MILSMFDFAGPTDLPRAYCINNYCSTDHAGRFYPCVDSNDQNVQKMPGVRNFGLIYSEGR